MATVRILKADGSVEAFDIRKVPARGVQLVQCVSIDGYIMGKTKSGVLYSVHGWPYGAVSYHGWTWHHLPALAKSLHRLGLITEADREATVRLHERERKADDISFAASQLEHNAEQAGVKLTKRQLAQIAKLKGRRV